MGAYPATVWVQVLPPNERITSGDTFWSSRADAEILVRNDKIASKVLQKILSFKFIGEVNTDHIWTWGTFENCYLEVKVTSPTGISKMISKDIADSEWTPIDIAIPIQASQGVYQYDLYMNPIDKLLTTVAKAKELLVAGTALSGGWMQILAPDTSFTLVTAPDTSFTLVTAPDTSFTLVTIPNTVWTEIG